MKRGKKHHSMHSFGLLGGIGSGKSAVAEMFCRLGAFRIDADQIGHEILLLPEIKDSIRKRWGGHVFDDQGLPDRRRIAALVFSGTEEGRRELEFLKSLTHPLITEEMQRAVRQAKAPNVLFDAPLLLEAGWGHLVDIIIFVEAPREMRLSRVLRRGWTEAEFDAREHVQLSLETKRARARFCIDNSGSLDATFDQVKEFWSHFTVDQKASDQLATD